MASAIASPTPLPPSVKRPARTDLQMQDDGRGTPVPQYERTQSVPFTLTLQEEKNNPGQFQLVVNIDPQHQPSEGTPPTPATSKKLYANLNDVSALGLNAPALYQTQKSSPPLSPSQDKHEWSDLDAIPQDFLHKVVPDWKVTFSRSDSTASTQSKRLSDIKARIKKKGKGYVVRLLKGSDPESNEVAEVHLGQQSANDSSVVQELDSKSKPNPVELEAIYEPATVLANEPATPIGIFEIGTSNEPGVECNPVAAPSTPTPPPSAIPQWLNQVSAVGLGPHSSIAEEGFSDAETLIPEVRSIVERLDDEQTEAEPFSGPSTSFPTRSGSVLSIVKTPTRGLSVVGPVRRIEKSNLRRAKGKNPRFDLNRSDARKSFRRSPNSSISAPSKERVLSGNDPSSSVLRNRLHAMNPRDNESTSEYSSGCYNARQHVTEEPELTRQKLRRGASVEEDFLSPNKAKTKAKLRLQTNVPRSKSANTSPVTRRKRSPRTHKPTSSSSSSISLIEENDTAPKTDPSVQLRDAIKRAFTEEGVDEEPNQEQAFPSIPRIEEPVDESRIGEILLPAELEIRSPPVLTRSPVTTFWGLAVSGLAEKVLEGIHMLRQRYGSEPPVPPKHVRVRWTCSCGELLYDDFIERRPGAARLLEAYLNRPRAHTPASPTSRSSTATSMSSVFSSASTASTLATPSSTYGGPSFWGRLGESSKYSPRLRTNTPFNIPIGSFAEESWLLTCANEGRFTPKIVHIDVNAARIRSDKDLAIAIREHYEQLNRRWYNWIRLRGLSTIEFVQFEVHRNRFADIRATPSMPPVSTSTTTSIDASTSTSTSEKPTSPSQHPYNFEPIDLLPPVGSTYLLHLFQHPSDYDGELITYLRSPKRRERLDFGMGWGINLVEGFLAQRVWAVLMALFGMGSAVFAVFWTVRKGDVQGAFGVAAWLLGLAGLVLGCVQAWLE